MVLGEGIAGAARLRRALSTDADPRSRLRSHLLAGWLEASAGDLELAERDLAAGRRVALELADEVASADVDRHEAFLALQRGRPDLASRGARHSLATYRQVDQPWEVAVSLVLAAYAALAVGDVGTATRDASAAVKILTPIDDAWALVHAQALLAGIARVEGRLDDAAHALAEAAEMSRVLGFPGQAALHLANLGEVEHHLGHEARAVPTLRRAMALAVAGGDGRLAATARLHLAQLLRARGEGAAAINLLEQNVDWYARSGGGDGALLSRCILVAETRDGIALASVLEEARRAQDVPAQVHALDAQAHHAALNTDPELARRLLKQADDAAVLAPTAIAEQDRHDKRQALLLLTA